METYLEAFDVILYVLMKRQQAPNQIVQAGVFHMSWQNSQTDISTIGLTDSSLCLLRNRQWHLYK